MYFIVEGIVSVYEGKEKKHIHLELDSRHSFGEIEYFKGLKNRLLLAKAASKKVVCYTLSYEMCEKFFPKMIEKEVKELEETATRLYNKIADRLQAKSHASGSRGQNDYMGVVKHDILPDSDEENQNQLSPKLGPSRRNRNGLGMVSGVLQSGSNSRRGSRGDVSVERVRERSPSPSSKHDIPQTTQKNLI